MKKSRYSEEQIIGISKQSEAGVKTPDLCREPSLVYMAGLFRTRCAVGLG